MEEQENDFRVQKDRSPSFPFISLPKAVERARQVAQAHKRSPARPSVLGETWGYGQKSSGLQQTLAALKAYGLLEDIGRGLDRRVVVSDLGWRILSDTRPGAKEQALLEAAVKPRLIAEYAQKWLPERPTDHHCISELHLDRGFTPTAAELFLKVFDETIGFANLQHSDSLSLVPQDEPKMHSDVKHAIAGVSAVGLATGVKAQSHGAMSQVPRATLPLPEGMAALELPPNLSPRSLAVLKAWIDVVTTLASTTDAPQLIEQNPRDEKKDWLS